MERTYDEMNNKMKEINDMIAELLEEAQQNQAERKAYEEAHGITDGDERLAKAMEEIRERQGLVTQSIESTSAEVKQQIQQDKIAASQAQAHANVTTDEL